MLSSNTGMGYLTVLISATCFATAGIFIKLAYASNITAWQLITIQFIISSITLVVITALYKPELFKMKSTQYIKVAFLGIVGTLGTSLLFFFALKVINAGLGTVLLYTYPAFITIGSVVFLGQRPDVRQIISLVLTLLGAILMVDIFNLQLRETSSQGIILALLGALCYAFYNLFSETLLKSLDALQVSTFAQVFSTLALIIIKPPWFLFENAIPLKGYLFGALLAIVTSVISFFFLLVGISIIGASKAAIVSTFELPVTLLLAYLILHETVNVIQIIGALLIVSSIILLRSYSESYPQETGGNISE